MKERLNKILVTHTGQDYKTIEKDTDRDNFMTAEEAKKYGWLTRLLRSKGFKTSPSESFFILSAHYWCHPELVSGSLSGRFGQLARDAETSSA